MEVFTIIVRDKVSQGVFLECKAYNSRISRHVFDCIAEEFPNVHIEMLHGYQCAPLASN